MEANSSRGQEGFCAQRIDRGLSDAILNDSDRRALRLRWEEGHLLALVDPLLAFAGRHRSEIISYSDGYPDPSEVLDAFKRFLFQKGTVNAEAEMEAQIREIQNECWYCGERGNYDRLRIQAEWAERHAAAWREWRMKEYLFVAERCADLLVETLSNPFLR